MNSNSFAITFFLKRDKMNTRKECPIYARVLINSEKTLISTKLSVQPNHWDERKLEIKKSHVQHLEMNNLLLAVKSRIYNCYSELLHQKKNITAQAVKSLYAGEKASEVSTIISASEAHLLQMEQFLGKGTSNGNYKNYKTTHKYLNEFVKACFKKEDIPLEDINYAFLKQYELFLQTEKNCGHNGAMKQMQRLKKILNWAIRNDHLKDNPFKSYKISFKRFDRGFLTQEEITLIEKLNGLGKKLQYTKDFFVFQLYTGLSYADMIDLATDDIVKGIDNELWIIRNRVKTDSRITVPLLPAAKEILLRYAESNHAGTRVFPRISNQKVNKNLKELCALAGINKPLSTHLARHSAATTIWLSNGISLETVSKLLGHTKITTTQIYGRIAETKIASEMSRLKEKLNS